MVGSPTDCWVSVLSLQSSDGGLLDPDDRLSDVADDREQIVAVFEERDGRSALYRGGDGTSASSDGTRSPVQFTNGEHQPYPTFSRVDVEVTGEHEPSCLLQVRRGSEPTLNQVCATLPHLAPPPLRTDASKRWSAAPIIDDDIQASSTPIKNTSLEQLTPPGERQEASGDERESGAFSRFARDSHRLSMQFGGNGDAMWRWADAAGRLQEADLQERRWEPVGANPSPEGSGDDGDELPPQQQQQPARLVVLTDVSGPLGMHVVPDCDGSGRDSGLLVQRVEPGSAVQRDGRVAVGDRIVQINGHSLRNISFQRAQEIFLSAMSAGQLRLLVEPGAADPPPSAGPALAGGSRVATVIPTKKPVSLSSRTQSVIQSSNTRKLGRRLTVTLAKGAAGLGFSVTTRDNPAGGHAPVYVKNILAQGAAVEDGRLRPGDRLLEIDGQPMAGLSQQQVVQSLRAVPPGHSVQLVISRHEQDEQGAGTAAAPAGGAAKPREDASPRLPRPLVSEQGGGEAWNGACLYIDKRISVKGKTTASRSGPLDVGIYIKSVIHGGAASKDGRLRRDDQLIDVNYSPLLGLSNTDAMETLRRAMCQEGPKPGVITLTVARRPENMTSAVSGRDSVASMLSNSSGELLSAGWRAAGSGDQSAFSEDSQVTVVARQPPPPPPPVPARPDRQPASRANIRNESYYRATHDTWDASAIQHHLLDTTGSTSTSGGGPGRHQATETGTNTAGTTAATGTVTADCAYASQTSLEHAGVGFTRDQLGRQSMSEKRHASKDAKSTDTYQRTKRAREEREAQRRQIEAELRLQEASERRRAEMVGPSLGLKKSSSLESLQTMVHELALAEDGQPRGPAGAGRGRGCNESFRAAVDRSYEAPLGAIRDRMETLAVAADTGFVACLVDEESAGAGGGGAFSRDAAARQSSMSSGVVEDKKGKRRSGLLKGLGSMFKFGKQRRSEDQGEPVPPVRTTSAEPQSQFQSQSQQQRITHAPPSQGQPAGPPPPAAGQERAPSRAERMVQLRQEHQRRHATRHGVYVTEAAEERAEQHLRQVHPGKPPGPHLSDQINNNVPSAGFVRGAQGARSSEYFRNPRPAPMAPRHRGHEGAGPPPHSWLGEDGGRPAPPSHQPHGGSAAVPSADPSDPRGYRSHPGGPSEPRQSHSGPSQPRGYHDPSDPRAYPGGPVDLRGYPGTQTDPRGYSKGAVDPRGYPNGSADPRGYSSSHPEPRGYPVSDVRAHPADPWPPSSGAGQWVYPAPGSGSRRPSAPPPPDGEPARPGSASGGERQRYGHYANYEQIRHHLSRQQQQYHSQRGRHPAEPTDRPTSCYYEHEAAAAAAAAAAARSGGDHSLPRHHERSRSGPAIGPGAGGVGVPSSGGSDPRLRPAPLGLSQQQHWRRPAGAPGPLQRPSAAGSHV
ncbi:Partitioning defective 3 [Amphibalanus amphitrite]|uniref:Partitioning defective 3 n=1 Tax=Amphibalanus amphitrite TaxID=1232801 RepID=A0A6A4XAH6_AMPAM|nr:Partitioning defective 3 [Amphibalanus amphitrite]